MITGRSKYALAVLCALMLWGYGPVAGADDAPAKKDGHLRVDELPKPLPEVMDGIKRVGNEASKGVAKVGKAVRETADKALSKTKEP